MPQFCVRRNPSPETKATYPLLLDVQSDLTAGLNTRLVVPLCPLSAMKAGPITTLTPVLEVDGRRYIMLTPQLAGIPTKHWGAPVATLARYRDEIVAALDLLITGI